MRATIALKGLSTAIIFFGEVLIAAISALIAYLLTSSFSDLKYAVITPTFVTAVCSLIIAFYIMEIVQLIIETIYFCFIYE